MDQKGLRFIPAPLLRVRRFLDQQGRMRVKPWATVEETLDAFHDALLDNRDNDAFWQGLQSLLAVLTADTRKRMSADAGKIIDNQSLDPERNRLLLLEIRRALAGRQKRGGGFRLLTAVLSVPALGLLLMLGGVASLGCYTTQEAGNLDGAGTGGYGGQAGSAGSAWNQAGAGGPAAAGSAGSTAGAPDASIPGAGGQGVAGKAGSTAGTPDASMAGAGGGTGLGDGGAEAGTAPPPVDAGCSKQQWAMEEIVELCLADPEDRARVLSCLDALHQSWRTGLEELFRCTDCGVIRDQLECLVPGVGSSAYPAEDFCSNPEAAGEYDPDTLFKNCLIPIYLGVRFE